MLIFFLIAGTLAPPLDPDISDGSVAPLFPLKVGATAKGVGRGGAGGGLPRPPPPPEFASAVGFHWKRGNFELYKNL